MSRPLHSQNWYSVASLRPRLLASVRINRHVYRGAAWFVLHEPSSGRVHRITRAANRVLERLDGNRTLQMIWDELGVSSDPDMPTQQEMVDLLGQLHTNDLLAADAEPDAAEVLARYRKRRFQPIKQFLMNPVSLKLPLVNPRRALDVLNPLFGWLWSPFGLVLWALLVAPAAVLGTMHWGELTENLSDRVLSGQNLLVLALVYPIVKLCHEFGHGLAARRWGAQIHEMGVIMMALAPIPYVDASPASAFSSKWRRAAVSASGMLVELVLAATAIYVWVLAEPGIVRAVAYNVILVAGISTVLVNGNPLARFDSYFILCDLLEIPNLGQRGPRYWTTLSDRFLFGSSDVQQMAAGRSERFWLFIYTPASWVYRIFLTLGIAAFVATQFFTIGLLLAVWSIGSLVLMPTWKSGKHLMQSPSLRRVRKRAIGSTLIASATGAAFLSLAPLPSRTVVMGVVWLEDELTVRMPEGGEFEHWLAAPGEFVQADELLAQIRSETLNGEYQLALARRDEARARWRNERFAGAAAGAGHQAALAHEQRQVDELAQRVGDLAIRASTAGRLITHSPQDFAGRYLQRGEPVGYLFDPARLFVRVVVSQAQLERLADGIVAAELLLPGPESQVFASRVLRRSPSGLDTLPSAVLSNNGGGPFATRPDDSEGTGLLERVLWIDLALPEAARPEYFGSQVHVRLLHPPEPLATAIGRRLRQALLSYVNV